MLSLTTICITLTGSALSLALIFAGMVVTTSDGRGKAHIAQPGNNE